MNHLRPVDDLIRPAVNATIAALTLGDQDKAAVRLAERYADAIDNTEDRAEVMEKLGPKLLAVLESLGATPAARARLRGGGGPHGESRLSALRAARGA